MTTKDLIAKRTTHKPFEVNDDSQHQKFAKAAIDLVIQEFLDDLQSIALKPSGKVEQPVEQVAPSDWIEKARQQFMIEEYYEWDEQLRWKMSDETVELIRQWAPTTKKIFMKAINDNLPQEQPKVVSEYDRWYRDWFNARNQYPQTEKERQLKERWIYVWD